MWLLYSKKVTTNFFLLFRASPNCFFDIPILYLVDKIPRIIFVNKNVINKRVGLSFALRCMYLPVNVKVNPNRDSLKKRIKFQFQFSVILKLKHINTFLLKNFVNWLMTKNVKALFSIGLEESITYALVELIDWTALQYFWKFSLGLNLDF